MPRNHMFRFMELGFVQKELTFPLSMILKWLTLTKFGINNAYCKNVQLAYHLQAFFEAICNSQ